MKSNKILGMYYYLVVEEGELNLMGAEGLKKGVVTEIKDRPGVSSVYDLMDLNVSSLLNIEQAISEIRKKAVEIVLGQVTEELQWEEPNSWDDQMPNVLTKKRQDAWQIVTGKTMEEIYEHHEGESYQYIASQYIDFDLKAVPKVTLKL